MLLSAAVAVKGGIRYLTVAVDWHGSSARKPHPPIRNGVSDELGCPCGSVRGGATQARSGPYVRKEFRDVGNEGI